MSVHLLKDGRWICRHEKGKDPARPNANKRYFGRGLEAERSARDFDALLHGKVPKSISSPLFVDIVNEYLAAKKMTMTKDYPGTAYLTRTINCTVQPVDFAV